jgi:MFS family permease
MEENPSQHRSDESESGSLSAYANVFHQKEDMRLITVSREKLEGILSASGSLSSNFLTLMIGTALTLFIALKSGGVEQEWRGLFWIAFWFSLVLCAFFGLLTIRQEVAKWRVKRELRKPPSTLVK